jgi:hypothetical protein
MPGIESNENVAHHSFAPQLSVCKSCHSGATDFDVIGGQTSVKAILRDLRTALNDREWLTRSPSSPYEVMTAGQLDDDEFAHDKPRPNADTLTADEAGALYNYLIVSRGSAFGVHNPVYTKQLLFDSYFALEGSAPPALTVRPSGI